MKPTYTDNVYKRLTEMKIGSEIIYDSKKGTKEDWDKFIVACKRFIDDIHIHPTYQIQIASDYSKIRKVVFSAEIRAVEKS